MKIFVLRFYMYVKYFFQKKKNRVGGRNRVGRVTPIKQFFQALFGSVQWTNPLKFPTPHLQGFGISNIQWSITIVEFMLLQYTEKSIDLTYLFKCMMALHSDNNRQFRAFARIQTANKLRLQNPQLRHHCLPQG